MIMIPEKDIVKGCKEGKKEWQKTLFERYAPKMLAICARYCQSTEEAEDVLQDGFIKVFKNLKDFKFKGSLEGWIRRIMINTALNHLKMNNKHMHNEDIDEIEEQYLPELVVNDNEQLEEILKIVQSLPDGYRTVFNLFEIEEYSHKEIARMLNISVNTSKSQLLKARRIMRKKLNHQDSNTNDE
jgi:RNA polymerase sigma factor (sigma-70 family)